MSAISRFKALAVGALVAASFLLVACGGEDRPNVDVIGGSGSGSVSSSASGEPAAAGVVETKPAEATQIDVTEREFEISPKQTSVKAGKVYFLVQNAGPEDAHEFVVIKTDTQADKLPVTDGKVPEGDVDIAGEIEPFTAGSSASMTLDLEKGHYVFICNIAEQEDGALESHYQTGMRVDFTVE